MCTPNSPDPRLTNKDLAPLRTQSWGAYNIFAFWMSDVHSVGGYVTAGSLFMLGLSSWQVLVSLLIGIGIVHLFCNLVAKLNFGDFSRYGRSFAAVKRASEPVDAR